MKYKLWRSNKDKDLHVLCAEGSAAFGALPMLIRQLGLWSGSKEGDVDSLRLAYRVMLTEHGFVLIYQHVSKIELENARPEAQMMAECPLCNGKARVPMHGGLREKECPRCAGRGWVKAMTPGPYFPRQ